MAKIKLNGFAKILGVIVTIIVLIITVSYAVGGKRVQVNINTENIKINTKDIKKIKDDFGGNFKQVASDLGLIMGKLGLERQEVK